MSIVLTVTVKCERPGCSTKFVEDGWPGRVRSHARKAGWKSKPDLCPAHPPGSENTGPDLLDLLTGGTA